jgi:hypothetical protein
MPADPPSFPEPPGQSKVRVLREADGISLTNEPDRGRRAADRGFDESGGRFPSGPHGGHAAVSSCLRSVFKLMGLSVVTFGGGLLTWALIATVVFDAPMHVNGRIAGKGESVLSLVGLLAFFVGFGAIWIFAVNKVFPAPEGYWRLELGDDEWVLRRGRFRRVLSRVSPHEIDGLTIDPLARVVAETAAGKRRPITGPMAPYESAWAVRALSGLLGTSSGAAESGADFSYAYVSAVKPAASSGTTLRYSLSRVDRPWKSALGCLAATLFWNGITWVFVWAHLTGGFAGRRAGLPEGWKSWLFLTPLVVIGLVGIVLFAFILWNAIVDTRAGSNLLEISANPMRPGERCRAFLSQPIGSSLRSLRLRLVCEEQVTYTQSQGSPNQGSTSTTESRRVREVDVYRVDELPPLAGLPFEATFEFEVPADAMHSLEVPNNRINWQLEVEGGPADRPMFRRQFAIVVNPPRPPGAQS